MSQYLLLATVFRLSLKMLSYFRNLADSGFVWSCGYRLLIKAVAFDSVLSSRVVYVALSYSSFRILSPCYRMFHSADSSIPGVVDSGKAATLPVEVEKSVFWAFLLAL